MAPMSRRILLPLAVAAVVAMAGAAWLSLRPEQTAIKDAVQAADAARACSEVLAPVMAADAFAGAAFGSGVHALGVFVKWTWLPPLEWIGHRSDLRMIVSYGEDVRNCYALDDNGYVIAHHSRHGEAWTSRWIERSDTDGRLSLTFYEQDSSLHDGKATARFVIGVDPQSGTFSRLQLAGRDAGERTEVGRYSFDAATGHLELHVGLENRVLLGSDGLLIRSYYRPCFDPEMPCEDPWEETAYTFDPSGNLIGRHIDFEGEKQHDDLALTVNARGDWVEWRLTTTGGEDRTARRAVFYRD